MRSSSLRTVSCCRATKAFCSRSSRPKLAAFAPDAVEPKRHWVVVRRSYTGIGLNTKLVTPDKAPKTYQDLLDPQWKGRMALSG